MKESGEPGRRRRAPHADEEDVVVVSVSLSQYFADARALSYTAVRRRRRARWLAARLARRWRLPRGPPALLLRGRLLPPAERLRALEPGDTIQVIPQGEDWFLNEDDLTSSSEDETRAQKHKISETLTSMRQDNEHEVKDQKRPQNETPDYNEHEMKDPKRSQEETSDRGGAGAVIEDASSAAMRSDAPGDLRALKRRALDLLDRCAPPEPDEPDAPDAPDARPRRRRVRRRARRPPPAPAVAALAAHTPDAGAVLMNGERRRRGDSRPRLVRPLH